jgi:hypothetical protein
MRRMSTKTFIDALTFSPERGSEEEPYTKRLRRVLDKAEASLTEAKLALAAGDPEAAHAALVAAAEAHTLAQEIRANKKKTVAA